MATIKISCPETINFAENNSVRENVINSANSAVGMPLIIGARYVLVPQKNFCAQYDIEGNVVTGARFYLIELDDASQPTQIRTISASSLMNRYVSLIDSPDDEVPTFETRVNADGYLRAKDLHQVSAIPGGTASFMKGVKSEDENRLEIIKGIVLTPLRRGDVATVGYEKRAEGAKGANVKTNEDGRAVCDVRENVYTFADVANATKEMVDTCVKLLKGMDHFYGL